MLLLVFIVMGFVWRIYIRLYRPMSRGCWENRYYIETHFTPNSFLEDKISQPNNGLNSPSTKCVQHNPFFRERSSFCVTAWLTYTGTYTHTSTVLVTLKAFTANYNKWSDISVDNRIFNDVVSSVARMLTIEVTIWN